MSEAFRQIDLHTASRLHFGLWSFGDPSSPHQFGGVGAMIRTPGLRLQARQASAFGASGKHADRVLRFATRIAESLGWSSLPACQIKVLAAPRQHVGLGTGTQLGLAVARLLTEWNGLHNLTVAQLASASGRGLRSVVGIHGFDSGGLIVDSGHKEPGQLGKLEAHCHLPTAWRFVLAIDSASEGLAQATEVSAFDQTPRVPREVTARLRELALNHLLPAARRADFRAFSASLYEYGVLAGGCFASVQGGPFASKAIARRVDLLRSLGYAGCGQSSWGPTVFAVTPSEAAAEELLGQLTSTREAEGCELMIAEVAEGGAVLC